MQSTTLSFERAWQSCLDGLQLPGTGTCVRVVSLCQLLGSVFRAFPQKRISSHHVLYVLPFVAAGQDWHPTRCEMLVHGFVLFSFVYFFILLRCCCGEGGDVTMAMIVLASGAHCV